MGTHRPALAVTLALALGGGASVAGANTLAAALASAQSGALQFSAEATTASSLPVVHGTGLAPGPLTLARSAYQFSSGRGTRYAFGTGATDRRFFGLESTGTAPRAPDGEASPTTTTLQPSRFNTPYFAMVDQARHLGVGQVLPDGTELRLGTVVQGPAIATAAGAPAPALATGVSVIVVELHKAFAGLTGVVTLGQMHEHNSAMGMTGTGAMALAAAPRTRFATLSASAAILDKASVAAMFSVGRTSAYTNGAASLIDGASASRTVAWSLGIAGHDVLYGGDSLGLSVSMPVKTVSGAVRVTTADSQDPDTGALQFVSRALSLRPSGSERVFEWAYARPLSQGGSFSAMARVVLQPGHDAQAPRTFGVGVRYLRLF